MGFWADVSISIVSSVTRFLSADVFRHTILCFGLQSELILDKINVRKSVTVSIHMSASLRDKSVTKVCELSHQSPEKACGTLSVLKLQTQC